MRLKPAESRYKFIDPPHQESVPFNVKIVSSNNGGLLGTVMGLDVFVPKSQICYRPGMDFEQVWIVV
jgi:ribosomal protein S1